MSQGFHNRLSSVETGALHTDRRRLALGLVVGLGGAVLSLFFFRHLTLQEWQSATTEFQANAAGCAAAVQHTWVNRVGTVQTLAAFYAASLSVERVEFTTFADALLEKHHGTQALGSAPLVSEIERQSYVQAVRSEGFPTYEITERDERGRLVSAHPRGTYCPVLFVEPLGEYKSQLGFDLCSTPACRAAIEKAKATGQPAAWIGAESGGKDDPLLYIVMPAKNRHADSAVHPGDQAARNGFVFGVFQLGAIIQGAINLFPGVGIEVSITAPSEAGGQRPLVMRPPRPQVHEGAPAPTPEELSAADMEYAHTITVADGAWQVHCRPLESYVARKCTWEPTAALLGGLLLTGLLVGYLLLLSGRTARVERMVAARTRELRESEERFRLLVDNASDAFFLRDEQGRILDVNKRTCDSLGYTRDELLSMTIADIDVCFVSENLNRYAQLPDDAYPVTFEGRQRRKDGETFPVEVRLAPVQVAGRRLLLALVRDITERKRAEEELRKEQRLLRDVLDLNERDRKLVAYEIHDGLAQQLTGALFTFQSVEPLRESDPDLARKTFNEALRLLREAMDETRRLIGGLRPPVLDESGVVAAIDYLIFERRQQGGPAIEFVHPANVDRLARALEGAVFRIVQECLTNACRYSQSERVRIELRQTEDRVYVDVQDWGIGFDPARVEGGHIGLRGIRERAVLLGGAAAIDAAPGKGARIRIELPFLPPMENGSAG